MKELLILPLALLVATAALAYEEPSYTVVERYDDYEVRRYEPYLVAETVVKAEFKAAGNEAFRRLFGYISGENRRSESLEMTTPVAGSNANEKIEMTVPVVGATRPDAPDWVPTYTYYFVLPSRYTVESAPRPIDPRITIREVSERTVAVRRYSGRSNERNYLENREELLEALTRDGQDPGEKLEFAVYNGPFTPWFMRRNEVMVEIQGLPTGQVPASG